MLYKNGVDSTGVQAPIWYAIGVFECLFYKRKQVMVVTSLVDGVHSVNSLHKVGCAVDIRTRDIPQVDVDFIIADAKLLLFPLGFDVVTEVPEGETAHIHVEYDPKPNRSTWRSQVA